MPSLKTIVKQEICAVNKWAVANKLTLNMSKSNVILINAKSSKACSLLTSEPLDIAALPKFLKTKCAKYLRVTFDNSPSFDLHIKNLSKKLSKSAGILAKLKPYSNTKASVKFVLWCLPFALAIRFNHMEINV